MKEKRKKNRDTHFSFGNQWPSTFSKNRGTYCTPFSSLRFRSSRCASSTELLAMVARSMSLFRIASVKSFHNLLYAHEYISTTKYEEDKV